MLFLFLGCANILLMIEIHDFVRLMSNKPNKQRNLPSKPNLFNHENVGDTIDPFNLSHPFCTYYGNLFFVLQNWEIQKNVRKQSTLD